MPCRHLSRRARRQKRRRLRAVRTRHVLPRRGRHDERRDLPEQLLLPDTSFSSGVPGGRRVPGRVGMPARDVLPGT